MIGSILSTILLNISLPLLLAGLGLIIACIFDKSIKNRNLLLIVGIGGILSVPVVLFLAGIIGYFIIGEG